MHDRTKDIFCTRGIDSTTIGMHRTSEDHLGPTTAYGRYLLQLGESHELVILNGLPCFPSSHFFTCRPFGGGASVVDYAIANLDLLPYIKNFSITPIPLIDHALLSLPLQFDLPNPSPTFPCNPPRTTFRFEEGDLDLFSSILRQTLPLGSQFASLSSTKDKYECLSYAIWEAALQSLPHSTRTATTSRKPGNCPMNKWYD